jgi:hypothetical protein
VDDPRRADATSDPLDHAPPTSSRGARPLVVAAWVLAVLAVLPSGLSVVLGPLGMGCGLVAHLKGRRDGFVAACVAAAATVVGLSIQAFVFSF